ncbi:MAG: hypothetical protein E6R04_10190 [Spirochaetes bacterium]|nr:MAG: hypothetical protein E6R04_10190 [Spirochaetota bacterium]
MSGWIFMASHVRVKPEDLVPFEFLVSLSVDGMPAIEWHRLDLLASFHVGLAAETDRTWEIFFDHLNHGYPISIPQTVYPLQLSTAFRNDNTEKTRGAGHTFPSSQ